MQFRCYVGGRGRTQYVRLRFTPAGGAAYTLALCLARGVLVLRNRFPV